MVVARADGGAVFGGAVGNSTGGTEVVGTATGGEVAVGNPTGGKLRGGKDPVGTPIGGRLREGAPIGEKVLVGTAIGCVGDVGNFMVGAMPKGAGFDIGAVGNATGNMTGSAAVDSSPEAATTNTIKMDRTFDIILDNKSSFETYASIWLIEFELNNEFGS